MPKVVRSATTSDEMSAMIREAARNMLPREGEKVDSVTLPPWKFDRETPRASLFWRMGGGEDYLDDFRGYFHSLNDIEKENFRGRNPEPSDWTGFYASLIE